MAHVERGRERCAGKGSSSRHGFILVENESLSEKFGLLHFCADRSQQRRGLFL